MSAVLLASLKPVVDRAVSQLADRHDTALVSPPGSGATTILGAIASELGQRGVPTIRIDLESPRSIEQAHAVLGGLPAANAQALPFVLIVDHAPKLRAPEFKTWLDRVAAAKLRAGAVCLWVGPLDARAIAGEHEVQIHAVPRSHVSFPLIPRDELLLAYRAIAEDRGCRWGEAVLYLLLDFCGSDLSLVRSAAEYLHGDWSDKLYDASVWDRIAAWLSKDETVARYRHRLRALSEPCRQHLALIRLGGKPPCPRTELLEEVDCDLRTLRLNGFIVLNLLPRFYQVRNLTMRLLIDEPHSPWEGYGPHALFRRAANERAAQLVHDLEIMLRGLLFSLFQQVGPDEVRRRLEAKQGEGEFIRTDFNRALLDWAKQKAGPAMQTELNAVILEHRKNFRAGNSVWARVQRMMAEDDAGAVGPQIPEHLRAVEYLTFGEMSDIVIDSANAVFTVGTTSDVVRSRLRERWREGLSRVRRLRNRVAHLRNVDFRSMEDLLGVIEGFRNDVIGHTDWKSMGSSTATLEPLAPQSEPA